MSKKKRKTDTLDGRKLSRAMAKAVAENNLSIPLLPLRGWSRPMQTTPKNKMLTEYETKRPAASDQRPAGKPKSVESVKSAVPKTKN